MCSMELKNWLVLYTLDPNLKLHPPRARRPDSERTFASSNYRLLMMQLQACEMSTWIVVRAVEELIKIHAPENWAGSFVNELNQSKKRKSFKEDKAGPTAQYLCKSLASIILRKNLIIICKSICLVAYYRVERQAAWGR